jgi:hypothetical protein
MAPIMFDLRVVFSVCSLHRISIICRRVPVGMVVTPFEVLQRIIQALQYSTGFK